MAGERVGGGGDSGAAREREGEGESSAQALQRGPDVFTICKQVLLLVKSWIAEQCLDL